jgi:ADP-heptose:LPS heptosyltransferase
MDGATRQMREMPMSPYTLLSALFPTHTTPPQPQRILMIRPCCIGDVVIATAVLVALRRAYPAAHITWAVGGWSRQVVDGHPLLDAVLDVGDPFASAGALWRFVRQVRGGRYDLVVSLSRSPRMSAAVWLAGVPYRAGIDSAGRGFGYNIRADVDPHARRHEADIYLDVVRALGLDTDNAYPLVPVDDAVASARALRHNAGIDGPYVVVNPSGGKNPGAVMDEKRYPPHMLADLTRRVCAATDTRQVVIVAGPGDNPLADAVRAGLTDYQTAAFVGSLTFAQAGALARDARLYIGNDTGLTHLAAAAGATTAMILGPTDPARYRPYNPNALALWQPRDLPAGGFAAGPPPDWDWSRDGIPPKQAASEIIAFLHKRSDIGN